MSEQYSDEECLAALRAAATVLPEKYSRREYEAEELEPSSSIIVDRFGGWNAAKREAGLPVNRGGKRAKPVRERYFESIDSVPKAYWLGMLFGDGSMVVRESGYRVQLTQRAEDIAHLERFKRTLRAENAIVEDESVYHIRIGNRTFAEYLRAQGFTREKGTDGSLPELESWALRRAFVRGISDADGYCGVHKWTLTDANSRRLEKLRNWIPFETDVVEDGYEDKAWAYLRLSGRDTLPAFYHWLYPALHLTEPAMARKRETAVDTIGASDLPRR